MVDNAPKASGAKRGKGPLVAVGVAVVVVILGALLWFFTQGSGGGADAGEAPVALDVRYTQPPNQQGTVALTGSDDRIELLPLQGEGSEGAGQRGGLAQIEGLTVFGAEVEGNGLLVAMDSVAVGRPVWQVQLSGPVSECNLAGAAANCGKSGTFDLATGESLSETSSSNAKAEDEQNPDAVDEDTGEEADTEPQIVVATKVPAADEDTPYAVSGQDVVDAYGQTIVQFGSGNIWQLDGEGSEQGTWVFTDGQKVAGVRKTEVVWERELPAGSAQVNAAEDTSSITRDGKTVLVGEPSALLGLNLDDGEDVWTVEAPLTSWFLDENALLVAASGDVHLLDFPSESEEESTSPSTQKLEAVNLPEPPTYEDLANGELQMPAEATDVIRLPNNGLIQLENGVYNENGTAPGSASVLLQEVEPLVAGNEAYAVALVSYGLHGSDAFGTDWIIYDTEKNLVDSSWLGQIEGVAWFDSPAILDYPDLTSDTRFVASPEGSFAIEQGIYGYPEKLGVAQTTWDFDGKNAEVVDFVLELPSGSSRVPDPEKMKEVYDLIATGKDREVAPYIDPDFLDFINWMTYESGESLRDVAFTPEGKVNQCVLVSPGWELGHFPRDVNGVFFQDFAQEPAGTWYCGVETSQIGVTNKDGQSVYGHQLVVTTDQDGTPYVKDLIRFYN